MPNENAHGGCVWGERERGMESPGVGPAEKFKSIHIHVNHAAKGKGAQGS